MKKYRIIVNPAAGGGSARRVIPEIKRLLDEARLDYQIEPTERAGHAIELAKEASLAGCDVVVAAGGDGTVNEVINGLINAEEQGASPAALGVLSIGRGNDFADGVGIPYDLEEAFHLILEDQRRLIDIGRVSGGIYPQGRYFGNCVGVGFDAITTIEVSKLPRLGGFLSFLIAVLKTIFLYNRGPLASIKYDDHSLTQRTLLISVMNGRRLGGGFRMAPDAESDDGIFDLCIAQEVSRARIFTLIPHFLRGTQATQNEITTGRAARVSITALEGSLPAQSDGEIISVDGQSLEIELLPRRLEIVSMVRESK
ncbi:MAG: diacylglycerol kinase family lipid kinase [Anaerolineales bacterium]|nr:diacylglycerol kinase family lipid kinase [Anaerolineales bacterium]